MKWLIPLLVIASLTACRRSETAAPAKEASAAVPAAKQEAAAPAVPAAQPKTPAGAPAQAADASALLSKAKGRWIRPDGGYLLTIGEIAADGRAEVGYFNPNPVNVAWGTVKNEGGAVKIQVELRDRNYPGCLYKLTYVPEKEQLAGTYFQAQMQETYDIVFVRE